MSVAPEISACALTSKSAKKLRNQGFYFISILFKEVRAHKLHIEGQLLETRIERLKQLD